jgi:hypothetical protein
MIRLNAAAVALLFMLPAASAQAKTRWQANHPRRAEVNARLDRQNARIREGVRSGRLTPGQAQQLHAEDRAIRSQERMMAAQNGGHITRAEKRALNQEENGVSRQIYVEKHR